MDFSMNRLFTTSFRTRMLSKTVKVILELKYPVV